ncbi:hypothetical protein BJV77DRAFT_316991 [Russula vinacea]|nr:hypothetical protein BJV77DRAFT_316991 [Russula vinacea]
MHQSAVRLSCIHCRLSRDTHFLAKCASTRSVWLSKFGFDGRSRDVPLLCRTLAPLPNLRASILISTTGQAAQSSLCAVTEMSTVPAHYFDQNSQGPVQAVSLRD